MTTTKQKDKNKVILNEIVQYKPTMEQMHRLNTDDDYIKSVLNKHNKRNI